MVVSTKDIAALRKKTGCGMMDCKNALVEAEGNFEKAIDFLRKQGSKIALNRADRDALQGAVFTNTDTMHTQAYLLALNCETDFVAKNNLFLELGDTILKAALAHKPSSIEELKGLPLSGGTVQEALLSSMSALGEKLDISAYECLKGETVVTYIHPGNSLAVSVVLQGGQGEQVRLAGRDIAMQIAAMEPVALRREDVDQVVIDRELSIIQEQVAGENVDTQNKAEKIIQGRLNKFFQENCLLSQPFVKNNKITVDQYLKQIAPTLTVTAFKRLSVGVQ